MPLQGEELGENFILPGVAPDVSRCCVRFAGTTSTTRPDRVSSRCSAKLIRLRRGRPQLRVRTALTPSETRASNTAERIHPQHRGPQPAQRLRRIRWLKNPGPVAVWHHRHRRLLGSVGELMNPRGVTVVSRCVRRQPKEIDVVPELLKNRSGKIMRRLLRDLAEGRELGDTSTLLDPGLFEAIRSAR